MYKKLTTILIEVKAGKIICAPAVTVYKDGWVQWLADPGGDWEFQLDFDANKSFGDWPFEQPKVNPTPRSRSFIRKVTANEDEWFKYTVTVFGVDADPYDPEIIVGRT